MPDAQRQVVLILGMHRSGTSALAGMVHRLGAAAPASMMEPAADNPAGFWESQAISELNEALMRAHDCHWFDCLRFDPPVLDEAAIRALPPHYAAVLQHEYGAAPCFVLKDPRFSLTLPFWLPSFASLDIAVAPILALRHPSEVVASLRRRDGMPAEIAAPLWLHYTLEAERVTRDRRRAVLSYQHFLQDWREAMARVAAQLGIAWQVPPAQAAAAIAPFLQPHMRHHHAAEARIVVGRPPLTGWIAETYAALRRLEQDASPAALARLDAVHAAFAAWRAAAPRISVAAATGQEALAMSTTPPTTSDNPATSPDRSVSFR
jgi:hypothetical protein